MRIAFVNQPGSTIVLPRDGQPLQSGSIGLWLYQVGLRCADEHEVWTLSSGARRSSEVHERCRFESVPMGRDPTRLRISNRYRSLRARLGLPVSPLRPAFDAKGYYRDYQRGVAEVLRGIEPDWIVVENFSQFVSPLRERFPNTRIAIHMHCDWLSQLDYDRIEARLRACDLVLGCSEYLMTRVRERFPAHASKCHAVQNGVDLDRFTPAEGTERRPEILFVGRLSPEKGVHVLIEAFRRVSADHPNARLRLIGTPRAVAYEYVVALDDDPIVKELSRFYAPTGSYQTELANLIPADLEQRVEFDQELPHHELVDAYRRASIFVFPSTWHEPFGLPVIEAMSCQVPVIATRSGGIPEILAEGAGREVGLLVERNDVAGLASALSKLLNDAQLRAQLGRSGRERAERLFGWERTTSTLLACLGK